MIIRYSILFLLCLFHVPTAIAKDVALFIGNETYKPHHGVMNVDHAMNDATAMAAFFESKGYTTKVLHNATLQEFEYLFGPRNGDEPSYIPEVQKLLGREPGKLVIFYAGHGAIGEGGRAYLLPVDGDPTKLQISGYAREVLDTHVNRYVTERPVFILDACFSGESVGLKTRPIGRKTTAGKAITIASTNDTQLSQAHPSEPHGLFTYFLLRGWRDGLAAEKGTLYAGGLVDYIEREVELLGIRQTPTLRGSRDLVLGKGIVSVTPPPEPKVEKRSLAAPAAKAKTLTLAEATFVGDVITVNPRRGKNTVSTINKALEYALDGDRIEIAPGIYREEIVIDKEIEIIGKGAADSVVIVGTGGSTVTASGRLVRLANLTIEGGGPATGGIVASGGELALASVIVRNNRGDGVVAKGRMTAIKADGCLFEGNGGHGVALTAGASGSFVDSRSSDNGGAGLAVDGAQGKAASAGLTGSGNAQGLTKGL